MWHGFPSAFPRKNPPRKSLILPNPLAIRAEICYNIRRAPVIRLCKVVRAHFLCRARRIPVRRPACFFVFPVLLYRIFPHLSTPFRDFFANISTPCFSMPRPSTHTPQRATLMHAPQRAPFNARPSMRARQCAPVNACLRGPRIHFPRDTPPSWRPARHVQGRNVWGIIGVTIH